MWDPAPITIPFKPIVKNRRRSSPRLPMLDDPSPTSTANPPIVSQTQTMESALPDQSLATITAVKNGRLNISPVITKPRTSANMTKVKSKEKTNTLQKNCKSVLNNNILTFARPATIDKDEVNVDPEAFHDFNKHFLGHFGYGSKR